MPPNSLPPNSVPHNFVPPPIFTPPPPQGLSFHLAAVLLSLGLITYAEHGECWPFKGWSQEEEVGGASVMGRGLVEGKAYWMG